MPSVFPTRTSPPPEEATMGANAPTPPPAPLASRVKNDVANVSSSHQVGTRQATRTRTRTRQHRQSSVPGSAAKQHGDDHPLSLVNLAAKGYHTFNCLGVPFYVKKRYTFMRELGIGAYGCVALAHDEVLDCNVAIKKVTRVFEREVLARRALREVAVLRHIGSCDNVTALLDFDTSFIEFNELYLVLEASEADLSQIIRSGQALSEAHLQYFLAQILRGVRYMHTANVIHRDLKPGNLLVNGDCQLKVCDFGLARAYRDRVSSPPMNESEKEEVEEERTFPDSPRADRSGPPSPSMQLSHEHPSRIQTTSLDFPGGPLTEYVATRWYRAPEIMLCFRRGYGPSIDMWSVGCILAELLAGKPIFAGKDYVDQIARINNILGSPSKATIDKIGSDRARTYVESLPSMPAVPFSRLFPSASPQAVDLLSKMLCWDSEERITADEALQHPWLSAYHKSNSNWTPPSPFERFDAVEMLNGMSAFRLGLEREADEMRAELEALEVEERQLLDSASNDADATLSNTGSKRDGAKQSISSSRPMQRTYSTESTGTPASISPGLDEASPLYETDLTSASAPHSIAGSHTNGKRSLFHTTDDLGHSSHRDGRQQAHQRSCRVLDETLADHGLLRGDEKSQMQNLQDQKRTYRRRAITNAPSCSMQLRRRGSEGNLTLLNGTKPGDEMKTPIGSLKGLGIVHTREGMDESIVAVHDALHNSVKTNDIVRRPSMQREGHSEVADDMSELLEWLSSTSWQNRRFIACESSDTTVTGT